MYVFMDVDPGRTSVGVLGVLCVGFRSQRRISAFKAVSTLPCHKAPMTWGIGFSICNRVNLRLVLSSWPLAIGCRQTDRQIDSKNCRQSLHSRLHI